MKPAFIAWKPFVDLLEVHPEPFGLLTVIRFEDFHPLTHRSRWWVTCACGSAPFVCLGNSLLSGHSKSCGCLRHDALVARNKLGKSWSASRRAAHERKTHCKRNHPRIAENITKSRACRICAKERRRKSSEPDEQKITYPRGALSLLSV